MKVHEIINETSLDDLIKWKAGVEISKKLPGWRPSDMWKKDEFPNLGKVGAAPKSDNKTKPIRKRKPKRPAQKFSLPKVTQPRTNSSISGDRFDASGKPFKESATAGSTAAGNIATVSSVPAAYRKIKKGKNGLPKAPQATNKDGTAKNAIDTDINLMGGVIKR